MQDMLNNLLGGFATLGALFVWRRYEPQSDYQDMPDWMYMRQDMSAVADDMRRAADTVGAEVREDA